MLIQSKRVWICGDFIPAEIEINDGKITEIYPLNTKPADKDYGDLRIVPGFLDIHCHGAYGYDTNYAEPEGLKKWAKGIVHEGVTGFMSTTITELKPVLMKAVKNVAAVKKDFEAGRDGADILGIHFEGPYLDMKYKGAQPPEAIVPPSVDEFKEYQEAANGLIKIITLAPEHDPDYALTRYCSENGVVVSIGHSGATFEQAILAVANGAKSITHTYNGQSPFNHRANGVTGTALRLHDLYSEVICDCNHSTPEALNIFFTSKGKDHGIMISDALMAKGFKPGDKFMFGGHEIEIYPDGSAHLTETKGLAGSTMRICDGLKNLVTRAGVPFDAALNSCTINPASLLGLNDHLGKIAVAYDADIVVLNDDYSVEETYCKGVPQF
ncbi:MAG: N-acetylglucosamine-6-phosphate deacetylase [Lactimicrobium sp.]|jgi:N-acetylglucosamine-6-phosphate deacetylase|uniref:N-acetylglucosamine-6-phosphate deacetylase n=1 Tax=Lactimicrobium sp. TaxID=2563780 RepID=UPI002F351938